MNDVALIFFKISRFVRFFLEFKIDTLGNSSIFQSELVMRISGLYFVSYQKTIFLTPKLTQIRISSLELIEELK